MLCSLAFSKISWLSSVLSLTFPSSSFHRKRGLPKISPLRLLCAAVERASYPLAAPDSRSELDTGESEKGEQDLKKFLAEAETCWDRDVIGFSASGA